MNAFIVSIVQLVRQLNNLRSCTIELVLNLLDTKCSATNIGSPRVGIVRGQELGGGTSSLHQVHCHTTVGKNDVAPLETIFNFRLVLFVIRVLF